jgi:hypothetical protein
MENQEFEKIKESAYNLGQTILNLCKGEQSGMVKSALTLCLATCINKVETEEDKLMDVNMIHSLLKDICKLPTLH